MAFPLCQAIVEVHLIDYVSVDCGWNAGSIHTR